MNTKFKGKLILYKSRGNTLFAFLLIVLIVGILVAITLPSFLESRPPMVPNSAAKTYIGWINNSQRAFFLTHKSFANSINELRLGDELNELELEEENKIKIRIETDKNYQYTTRKTDLAVFSYAIPRHNYTIISSEFWPFHWETRKERKLNRYVGAAFILPPSSIDSTATKDYVTTEAILCEAKEVGNTKQIADPFLKNGIPTCPSITTK